MMLLFARIGIATMIVAALLQIGATHTAKRVSEGLAHLATALIIVTALLWIIGWPRLGDR